TISAQDLYFSFDERYPVLEDIHFVVKQGQFVGIFGPNGGGKTTLLQLLLGLLIPKRGQLQLLGTTPAEASSRIGYVPQIRRFDKQFPISVLEVVLHGCLSKHRGFDNFSKETK